jgi:hypothetical protein
MKASIKQILAASALAAMAATPAFAFDPPSGGTGNGSLVVTVFDTVRQVSVIQDLGLNYLDFLNGPVSRDGTAGVDVTPDSGLNLSFSVDMSIFAGSNAADIRYHVFAADGQGNAATTEVLVTASPTLGTVPGTNGHVTAAYGQNGYLGITAQCGAQLMNTVCTGDAVAGTGVYAGVWGTDIGVNGLQFNPSAQVGETLGFYGLNRSGITAGGAITSYQFANASGIATWLLDGSGNLSWNVSGAPVVPLPAAVWLLLSGLGGLGVISRRRKEEVAA